MSQYNGNTEFVQKGSAAKLTLRDVFSDMFKKHSLADGERLFVSGMSSTTPSPANMLREWQKPWLFVRVLGACLAVFVISFITEIFGILTLTTGVVGTAVVPLAFLIFTWELNIPRNIPVYKLLFLFFAGGMLSLLFMGLLLPLREILPEGSLAYTFIAASLEEIAKLGVIVVVAAIDKKSTNGCILTGLLIGSAIGNGFSAFESGQYFLFNDFNFGIMLLRAVYAPAGHGLYTALYGGALFSGAITREFRFKRLLEKEFLLYFLAACALHTLWNLSVLPYIPIGIFDLSRLILMAAKWLVLLTLINKGVKQIVDATAGSVAFVPAPAPAVQRTPHIYCVSGVFAGQAFPLAGNRSLVLGRDPATCNLLFPAETPGISRSHCTIMADGQGLVLTDNGSSQGTFLDGGKRLPSHLPTTLNVGQKFYLASTMAMFEVRL